MDGLIEDSDKSFEAMDVDHSLNSVKDIVDDDVQITDIIYLDSLSPKKTEVTSSISVKRFYLNIENSRKKYGVLNSFVIFVAICAMFTYILMTIECFGVLDLQHVNETLKANLYGQNVAIKSIVEALSSEIPIKILFLYGGTGVGKTYTSSLIFNKFWQCSNIYHYIAPNFWHSYSSTLMFGLFFCKSSIIIIDDLTILDTESQYHIKAIVEKSQNLNKNLTVILLYNSDLPKNNFIKQNDKSFGKKLMKIYSHMQTQKYFIEFKEITDDILRKCVQSELNGKLINNELMNNILKNFNASSDGCKNVGSKLKYLNLS